MKLHFCLLLLFLVLQGEGLLDGHFVTTSGARFMLNGAPFYGNGFNAYWLMFQASDPSLRPTVCSTLRQAAARGLQIVRTWAFSDGGYRPLQQYPGYYNEETFKGLDFVIAEARRHGIRLILSLVNNYDSFGGKKQYVNWARNRGQSVNSDDDFFRNNLIKEFYKNHVKMVLNRYNTITGVVYRNDPTIMAWELMNEPRCTSDPSGRTIQSWIREMAFFVKSIDTNHLLGAGLEGFYGPSSPSRTSLNHGYSMGTDFIANNRIPGIDFASVHAYPDQWLPGANSQYQLYFLSKWLGTHIQDAEYIIRKPLLIAEFGLSWKAGGFSPSERDALFNMVFSTIYASAARGGAAAGGLFWQALAPGMDSFRDGYEIVFEENSSVVKVITVQARRLSIIRKMNSTQD